MRASAHWLRPAALAAVLVVTLQVDVASVACSQVPAGTEALIEEAERSGMTVIVIAPDANEPVAAVDPAAADGFETLVAVASTEVRRIVGSWGDLRAQSRAALAAHGDGGLSWILPMLLLGLIPLAVGLAAAWLLGRWLRERVTKLDATSPRDRADRLLRLLGKALLRLALLTVVLAVMLVVAAFMHRGSEAWQVTTTIYLRATALIGLVWIVLSAFLAPKEPHLRVLPLTDGEAGRLQRHLMIAIALAIVLLGACRWMLSLGVARDALKPAVVVAMLVSALAMSIIALVHRAPIGRLIVGRPDSGIAAGWRVFLARFWPVLAVAYFLISWVVGAARVVLDQPNALGLVMTPVIIILGSFALYGILLLVVDLMAARSARLGVQAATAASPDGQVAPAILTASTERPVLRRLLELAAAVVSFAIGVYLLSSLWGLDEVAGETVSEAVIQIIIVLLVAYIGYQAARLWIDRKIADEAQLLTASAPPGAHAPTRLGTLLPILRNFILVSIAIMTTLIVLSRLGVDIGPLLAGAGVVGLAIGFGAQTLVKDIISGAFFLVDDAFRVGEYIDLGGSKGTVEKISIRSMQLRHQNGPLNTVPFGSIGEVSNFSRDWAVMKLPLRVTYDTDAEKVRKLVKKLGEELLKDPDIGPYFLQPLKSQGITAMEDSAMVIRVKFMTHPANQSEVRKAVYARIQELFQREGIRFAQKEVRVRITGDDEEEGSTARRSAAAHAAAQAVVDEDDAKAAAMAATGNA